MKQKVYIYGVVNFLVILTGAIFKVNHFPGAGNLLTLGIITLVLFTLPVALRDLYRAEAENRSLSLYIVTYITVLVVFTAILFKIMHWPYSGILITLALPFPYVVFLPVFLYTTSKNRNFSIYNTVFVLFLLALNSVFSLLLALNVSKERIDDSFRMSGNYNILENVLVQLSVDQPQSPVNIKIDEVLNTVNKFQGLILKFEGLTLEQWKTDPGNLWRPDSRGVAIETFKNSSGISLESLPDGLRDLIGVMGKTAGYELLAKDAPKIFDFREYTENSEGYINRIFNDQNLAWTLIYLDGLRTNLLIIKGASPI